MGLHSMMYDQYLSRVDEELWRINLLSHHDFPDFDWNGRFFNNVPPIDAASEAFELHLEAERREQARWISTIECGPSNDTSHSLTGSRRSTTSLSGAPSSPRRIWTWVKKGGWIVILLGWSLIKLLHDVSPRVARSSGWDIPGSE